MSADIARLEVQVAWELAKLQRAAERVRRARRRDQLAARHLAHALSSMEVHRRGYTIANTMLASAIALANPRFDRRVAAGRMMAEAEAPARV